MEENSEKKEEKKNPSLNQSTEPMVKNIEIDSQGGLSWGDFVVKQSEDLSDWKDSSFSKILLRVL